MIAGRDRPPRARHVGQLITFARGGEPTFAATVLNGSDAQEADTSGALPPGVPLVASGP